MNKIKEEPNSESFSGLRKRKAGPAIDHEELQKIEKRRTQQNTTLQPLCNYKKAKEDQLEKYIQDLESKNKTLLAKITDLSSLNKKLSDENVELKKPDNKHVVQKRSIENNTQKVFTAPKTVSHKLQRSEEILSTQALVALWEEVSSTPLPQCSCCKSQAMVIGHANPKVKKYKAYKA